MGNGCMRKNSGLKFRCEKCCRVKQRTRSYNLVLLHGQQLF